VEAAGGKDGRLKPASVNLEHSSGRRFPMHGSVFYGSACTTSAENARNVEQLSLRNQEQQKETREREAGMTKIRAKTQCHTNSYENPESGHRKQTTMRCGRW
jgi:hypothetical protein